MAPRNALRGPPNRPRPGAGVASFVSPTTTKVTRDTPRRAALRRLVWRFDARRHAVLAAIFALFIATVFAQIWFASTPLPLGGPNVICAGAAIALAVWWCAWRAIAAGVESGAGAAAARLRELHPAPWALAVALATWLWVLTVYLWTNTFDTMRFGQLSLGIGVLFALPMCLDSAWRAKALTIALVVATAASAVFGFVVFAVGEPFLSVWLHVAQVSETDLNAILLFGRAAGIAAHPGTFAYQLATAIPLAAAALLHGNFGRRKWTRRCFDAALFLALFFLVAILLVNASRSTLLGASVGVALGVAAMLRAPSWRTHLRRLLVVAPLLALGLLALFNPLLNIGDLLGGLREEVRGQGDIETLRDAAAVDAPVADGFVKHRFAGFEPGVAYEVELRERYRPSGFGQPSATPVTAAADGGLTLTWRLPDRQGVAGYQFRVRRALRDEAWPEWRNFAVSLRPADLRVGGLRMRRSAPPDGGRLLGVHVVGVKPATEYVVQLRAVSFGVAGTPSEIVGTADGDGAFGLVWERPPVRHLDYEYRVRERHKDAWKPWRFCFPLRAAPNWLELATGSETLRDVLPGDPQRIGHEFGGLFAWKWYVVGVRERLEERVARAPRQGEIVVKPQPRGSFTLTWPTPPGDGVGYQFRLREIDDADWLAWRDFAPSLSSRSPALDPRLLAADETVSDAWIQHAIVGLPLTEHAAQVRARTPAGFGAESETLSGVPNAAGTLRLAWRRPPIEPSGYQFRLWWVARGQWRPWQHLQPPFADGGTKANLINGARNPKKTLAAARTVNQLADAVRLQPRMFSLVNTQTRLHQAAVALRYVLDHPLGTGAYAPRPEHLGERLRTGGGARAGESEAAELATRATLVEEALEYWPHNQFLHVLVLYGFPGLALVVGFYALLARAAFSAGRRAWAAPDIDARFLAVAGVTAWIAYTVNSLFFPTGPFVQDWPHFFIAGLLLGLGRLVAPAANDER